MQQKRLVMIATYNECDNVVPMYMELETLNLQADFLFIDDNSPDGTGGLLDQIAGRDSKVHVMHRPHKLGIGDAHLAGIRWAYDHGYNLLLSLDCDFTHKPMYLQELLRHPETADLVLGSRYLAPGSLQGWAIHRRALTRIAHALTGALLQIRWDATTSLRRYHLDRIPPQLFDRIESKSYAFFFETVYVLATSGISIGEIPVVLPVRASGSSKMRARDVFSSIVQLGKLLRLRLRLGRAQRAVAWSETRP
jgi:dolichol-phosphate mannosyltransferase